MNPTRGLVLLLGVAAVIASCDEAVSAPYDVRVRVTTDMGEPVAAAELRVQGGASALSDAAGFHRWSLRGRDGERRLLKVSCPAGHRDHAGPVPFVLRRLAGVDGSSTSTTEIATECIPRTRQGVLVVRARGAGVLPVVIDGKQVGLTNDQGVAHLPMELVPGSELRVTLDTTAQPRLIPTNPTQRFIAEDRDSILAFDATFRTQAPRKRRRRSVQDRPYRIN